MNEIEELKNRVEVLETELTTAAAILEQQQVVNTKFSEKIVQIFEILKMAFPSTFH